MVATRLCISKKHNSACQQTFHNPPRARGVRILQRNRNLCKVALPKERGGKCPLKPCDPPIAMRVLHRAPERKDCPHQRQHQSKVQEVKLGRVPCSQTVFCEAPPVTSISFHKKHKAHPWRGACTDARALFLTQPHVHRAKMPEKNIEDLFLHASGNHERRPLRCLCSEYAAQSPCRVGSSTNCLHSSKKKKPS